MSHAYYKIWLHAIWATHNRDKILYKSVRPQIISHIEQYCKKNDIYVKIVNGVTDHLHLLMSISPKIAPATAMNLIKGESSNWINKENLLQGKFSWQEKYAIFSISESQINKVVKYIRNQEKHHRRMTYDEEIDKFLKAYNIVEVTP